MKRLELKKLGDSAMKVLTTAGRISVITASLFLGFTSGEIYRAYQKGMSASKMPQVQHVETTSVAINDRGEVMIIDRESGKYMLFDDSVGRSIFNQYASRIYVKKQININ